MKMIISNGVGLDDGSSWAAAWIIDRTAQSLVLKTSILVSSPLRIGLPFYFLESIKMFA